MLCFSWIIEKNNSCDSRISSYLRLWLPPLLSLSPVPTGCPVLSGLRLQRHPGSKSTVESILKWGFVLIWVQFIIKATGCWGTTESFILIPGHVHVHPLSSSAIDIQSDQPCVFSLGFLNIPSSYCSSHGFCSLQTKSIPRFWYVHMVRWVHGGRQLYWGHCSAVSNIGDGEDWEKL